MGIYNFYRTFGIEWVILIAFLSYGLFVVCGAKKNSLRGWQYILYNVGVFCLFFPVAYIIPFSPLFATQGVTLWYFFVSSIAISQVLAHFLLNGTILSKASYSTFYMVFVLLFKLVCSPLYERENQMPPNLYIALDIAAQLILFLLLFFLVCLFKKVQLSTSLNFVPLVYWLATYFPLSFFIFYLLYLTNQQFLNRYITPLLALIILTNLPIVYFVFASVIHAYEDRIHLDHALTETKAQLARYSFSIELEERLKKERHELKNNYFYIQALLKEHKYEQLMCYLDEVIAERLDSLSGIFTGNTMIDYILNLKMQQAHQYDIKTCTEILLPEQLPIDDHLLCTILLNLLDNAIDASRQEKDADIQITIKCVQNYLSCEVKNKTTVDVLAQNPTLHTTKPDAQNHGFGIRIIRDAVRKSDGIFETSMKDGYFSAVVMLRFPSSSEP